MSSAPTIQYLPHMPPKLSHVGGEPAAPQDTADFDYSLAGWAIHGPTEFEWYIGAKLFSTKVEGQQLWLAEIYFIDAGNKRSGTWRTYRVTFPAGEYRHDSDRPGLLAALRKELLEYKP